MTNRPQLPALPLPQGVRSRYVPDVNGLIMHVLEAGHEGERPLIVLLHGFPELAFSWRKVIAPLAEAGFHVVAPDQRGYGRTTGWDGAYDGDLASFRMINLVRDVLALVAALGRREAHAVIGHDFGSPVAANCALIRPDVFPRVAMMSAPFAGPPQRRSSPAPDVNEALHKLDRPRKHYQWYYSTREADANMRNCPQGLHAFLRAYYHYKSADWRDNRPYPLEAWSAEELAKMPTYYIMDANEGMAETVAPYMPSRVEADACTWLSDDELAIYAGEFARTGFQGGLQWYRCNLPDGLNQELDLFAGRTIDVPSLFIAGKSDWGVNQVPGVFERMQRETCTDMRGAHLINGAGHWVQQERPHETLDLLMPFLTSVRK
ncbi:MAG: alpha/beta fold hydrolase [Methylobacteriaceae bacterium]|nr:alpha/beta fold hydrolase [Methylobacteriaceae bacterium]